MSISFLDVLISVFALVLFMIPGYIASKAKFLSSNAAKDISNIVLYFCTTLILFLGFQKCTFDERIGWNMLIVLGISLLVHVIMFVFVKLVLRKNDKAMHTVRLCGVFANCLYMGLPFLEQVFGNSAQYGEILVYAAVTMVPFTFTLWTLGFDLMGKKEEISWKRMIKNPLLIATVLSLIIFVTVKVPFREIDYHNETATKVVNQIMGVLESIAHMVTPLSMFIVGLSLGGTKIKTLFIDKKAYLACSIKLIVMPIITMAIVLFLPIDVTIKYTLFFLLAMPCAAITFIFSLKYDGDSDLASKTILLSNILSIVTIPLLYLLFDYLVKLVN